MAKIDGLPTDLKPEDTDLSKAGDAGALSVVLAPVGWSWGGLLEGIKGATGLPPYGSKQRDAILRASVRLDDMWRAAVNKAITKHVARGYTVDDTSESPRRLEYAKGIVASYDGGNYYRGLSKGLRDYLTTNYGQVAYVDRPAPGARVRGLFHLDSLRCTPYPHDDYPMLYQSPTRGAVLLRAENIIHLSDMPDSDPVLYNTGLCAADAAWNTLLKIVAIETYIREKVSGSRNLAIHFITGVNPEKLREALSTSDATQKQQGYVVYKGSTIIPMLAGAGGEQPTLITIPLAEIPDGFAAESERRDAYLRMANNIGIFVGELQPLSGQGLGTGTQTVVLDEAAEGQGLAGWARAWGYLVSDRALPETSTYKIATNDVRDKKARADAALTTASFLEKLVMQGALSAQQMTNIMVDEGYVAADYLAAADATAQGQLTDEQKPLELPADAQQAATVAQPPALPAPGAAPVLAAKAARRVRPDEVVIDAQDVSAALRLLQEVRNV